MAHPSPPPPPFNDLAISGGFFLASLTDNLMVYSISNIRLVAYLLERKEGGLEKDNCVNIHIYEYMYICIKITLYLSTVCFLKTVRSVTCVMWDRFIDSFH